MPSSPKKPQDHKKKTPTYGKGWKSPLTDLQLPSGETCQVKRPGIQGLIKAGVLHSLDALTSIVQSEVIPKAEGKPPVKAEALLNDPEKFGEMMSTVDKIVLHVVVQPSVRDIKVTQADIDAEGSTFTAEDLDREMDFAERPDAVYIDYIDSVDKMFIMNFAVGGSADLVEFREKTSNAVGVVPDGEAAALPSV